MYRNDEDYKDLSQTDKWKLMLCGYYALKKLEAKYDHEKNKVRTISTNYLCNDGRRASTIRKHLYGLGLVAGSYLRGDADLIPIDEEIEKILEGYSKEPSFNTSGYLSERENAWSHSEVQKPVTDLKQVYRTLSDLNAYEVIHVYLNQKLYDFKIFKTTYINSNRRTYHSSSYDSYTLKIYPVNVGDVLDESVINSNSEKFAKENAREILTAAFGCRFRAVHNNKNFAEEGCVENLISDIEKELKRLSRMRKELLLLKRKTLEIGGTEALRKKLLNTSIEYIQFNTPIWLNGEDKDRKDLALLMCKGTKLTLEEEIRR